MNEFTTIRSGRVNLHMLAANHYRKNHIQLKIVQPLSRHTVTALGILPHVWLAGSREYPSPRHIAKKLDSMYGAQFRNFVSKEGQQFIIHLQVTTIHELAELQIQRLDMEAAKFLMDLVNAPHVDNGGFLESVVEQKKYRCLKELEGRLNHPEAYAMFQCLRLTTQRCGHSMISEYGYETDYDLISGQSLYQSHAKLLQNAEFHVYATGKFADVSDSLQKFSELLLTDHVQPVSPAVDAAGAAMMTSAKEREPHTFFEYKEMRYSLLNLAFQTGIDYASEHYASLMLFITFMWGLPKSRLLVHVREKLGLAYHIAIRHDASTGILLIQIGIKATDWELVRDAVRQEVLSIKRGKFGQQEFIECQMGLKHLWMQQLGDAETMIRLDFSRKLGGFRFNSEKFVQDIERITPESLVEAASRIVEDCTYVLHNERDLEGDCCDNR
jgi:predicted Zn-dependent peptidase